MTPKSHQTHGSRESQGLHVMPSRRTFELIVITVVLMAPAMSMIHLWARKHIVTTGTGPTADAASVVTEIL